MKMAVRLPAAKTIANMTWRDGRRASSIVSTALTGTVGSCTIRREEYDVDEKRMPAAWMTSRRDEYDVDEKRMPAGWMTSRHDKYDVNEDGGEAASGKDNSKYDTARRSMSFVNC